MASWWDDSREAGVEVLYHHRRKLVGDRTSKSRLDVMHMTVPQFADNVALFHLQTALSDSDKKLIKK